MQIALVFVDIEMHDGSKMRLTKRADAYDPRDGDEALQYIRKRYAEGEVVTGLIYIDEHQGDLHELLDTTKRNRNETANSVQLQSFSNE